VLLAVSCVLSAHASHLYLSERMCCVSLEKVLQFYDSKDFSVTIFVEIQFISQFDFLE
jgi:hypothetical protein